MSGNTGVMEAKTIRLARPAVSRPRAKNSRPASNRSVSSGIASNRPIANGANGAIGVSGARSGAKENLRRLDKKAFSEAKSIPGVSVFAVVGTFAVSTLMVFVVLAQINYNETAAESVRLSSQVRQLTEQHRVLELAFESSFDISEVERIAQEDLGMTKPEASQVISITTTPRDSAVVIIGEEKSSGQGFIDFVRSLTEYFKR